MDATGCAVLSVAGAFATEAIEAFESSAGGGAAAAAFLAAARCINFKPSVFPESCVGMLAAGVVLERI